MPFLLAIPLLVRLVLVFVVAAGAASLANAAIYQFAWQRRLRSPWQARAEGVASRTWLDRVPVLGWWRLRRESAVVGKGHWIRPLLIEIVFPLGMTWLYWWETEALGLFASQLPLGVSTANLLGAVHWQFAAHAMLAWFMLIATFIDVDDRIIPDTVTVPCTLLGLLLATFVPLALLPQITQPTFTPEAGIELLSNAGRTTDFYFEPVHLAASSDWPAVLFPNPRSLALAIGCYWLWCFAFVRRWWFPHKGLFRAVRIFVARAWRDWNRAPLREVTLLGTLAIVGVWWWSGPAWVGLLSSLVGLVGSGGVVWLIRIFAGAALRREAMGFGDVLLMMMIGTLIGWQAGVIVFFMAPFAAIVFGIANLIANRDNELPYGPFLCAATMGVMVFWDSIWDRARPLFDIPWLVPTVLLVCLVLCGGILAIWQAIKDFFAPPEAAE